GAGGERGGGGQTGGAAGGCPAGRPPTPGGGSRRYRRGASPADGAEHSGPSRLEDSHGAGGPARGGGGLGRVARLRRVLFHHGRRARPLWRPRHLLGAGSPTVLARAGRPSSRISVVQRTRPCPDALRGAAPPPPRTTA